MNEYEPTLEWFKQLSNKYYSYSKAREDNNYLLSDSLRKELENAGVVDLDKKPKWHPVFESTESRSKRLTSNGICK